MRQNKTKKTKISLLSGLLVSAALLMVSCSPDAGQTPAPDKKDGKDQKTAKAAENNPFFSAYNTPFNAPPFDKIKPEHYEPAFKKGMEEQKKEVEAIISNTEAPSFANTIEALDNSGQLLSKVGYVFGNLRAADTNDELQQIAKDISPLMSKHRDDIALNEKLFARVKAIYEQKDKLNLTVEQKTLLENHYKNFVRGGANLKAEQKDKFRKINSELALLSLKFGECILKENNDFQMVLDKKEDLVGLPQSVIDAAAETAKERKLEGKWVFTLHKPSLIPFLQFSSKRELREKMFKGYINRGNNGNELDTKDTLKQIVKLRIERANLLGYETHSHYILEEYMAKKPENVYKLLNKLWKAALPIAKKEVKELQAIIDKEGGTFKLEAWDWWYYAEKLKKAKYDLDDNELRPYFKLENVREGAFYVANKLYGITFTEIQDIPKYHADVKAFEVKEADGKHIGVLYVDYFPRSSKRGGAWMNAYRKQNKRGGKHVNPIITNVCNFTKPTADTPSLLSFDEVGTLFHEFGHALHGLLANSTYDELSGTSVATDFVELPSQIMENWASEPEVLKVYAKHYKTGEVIPQALIDKLKKSGHFNQGFITVEYLSAALLDMGYHTLKKAEDFDVLTFEKETLDKIGLIPEIVVRYRSSYFRHIFAGGYSSGYYSYIWSAVLDADAFEAFKEKKDLFHQETAKAFRENVLSKGGTDEPMNLYKAFRGAEPKIEPLLKRRGLK